MAVGDQQTYSRMVWLKIYHPSRYAWLLPLPGEFHFTVHVLMALHQLWDVALVHYAVPFNELPFWGDSYIPFLDRLLNT